MTAVLYNRLDFKSQKIKYQVLNNIKIRINKNKIKLDGNCRSTPHASFHLLLTSELTSSQNSIFFILFCSLSFDRHIVSSAAAAATDV